MATLIKELEKLLEEAKKLLPDEENDYYPTYQDYPNYFDYGENNPCAHCMNNPAINKFATGFCNCVLPYMNNPIY